MTSYHSYSAAYPTATSSEPATTLAPATLPAITKAMDILKNNGCIAYPTEAVWGLGCDPHNPQALTQLLALKQRSPHKGLILIASKVQHFAPLLAALPTETQQRIRTSWQADQHPTTWIVPHLGLYSALLTGGRDTIAIRVSNHAVVQQLCNAWEAPLVSTSANISGDQAATTLKQCQQYFGNTLHYVPGNIGNYSRPSCIIDALTLAIIRA